MQTQVGLFEKIDGNDFVVASKGKPGFALHCLYKKLDPAKYYVTLSLSLSAGYVHLGNNTICGRVEVCTAKDHEILAQTNLYVARLQNRQHVQLSFELAAPAEVEFRVYTNGMVPLLIGCDPIVKVFPDGMSDFTPIFDAGTEIHDDFYLRNARPFRDFFELGIDVGLEASKAVVRFGDFSVFMKRDEQFQIVHEVFVHLDYNFLFNRDSMFIDVGMNCGFTALYAAQFGHVKEVHGFEPFHIPFNDAVENFSL